MPPCARLAPTAQPSLVLPAAPGVKVVDSPDELVYPMPLDVANQDMIYVGASVVAFLIEDPSRSLTFWCCGDQIRKVR